MKSSRFFLILSIFLVSLNTINKTALAGDDPRELIRALNLRMQQIKDYQAKVHMQFRIPGVKMKDMNGKVYFKQPDKFRIKAKGIFFLPKQNPMQQVGSLLQDTASYTTVISGYEVIEGKKCAIVNIIPIKNDQELILGKFWIDVINPLIYKSQITTRNNGTLETQNTYGNYLKFGLPDQILIKVEVNKIKVPKMMAVDLNKKSSPDKAVDGKEPGWIQLTFSSYQMNTRFPDSEFNQD
ncbi:MAG: hypothetical protein JNM44_05585 [Chitinophagaceae bacterium]|nr:hypothetical protein [Chitinophagaceae bacterium]